MMWGIIFDTLNNYYYFVNFIRYMRDEKLIMLIVEDDAYIG